MIKVIRELIAKFAMKKGTILPLILFFAAVILIISILVILDNNSKSKNQNPIQTSVPSPTSDTSNWKTFQSEGLGIEFKHPHIASIKKQGDGSVKVLWPVNKGRIEDYYIIVTKLIDFSSIENYREGSIQLEEFVRTQWGSEDFIKFQFQTFQLGNLKGLLGEVGGNSMEAYAESKRGIYRINFAAHDKRYSLKDYELAPLTNETRSLFNQILSTFRFTDQAQEESLSEWTPICQKYNHDFNITVDYGDGKTQISRKALNSFLNVAVLTLTPQTTPSFFSNERVYSEDYIVKNYGWGIIRAESEITIPCILIERAVTEARKLTISEKSNLEKYGNKVTEYQVDDIINNAIEDAYSKHGGVKPQILNIK